MTDVASVQVWSDHAISVGEPGENVTVLNLSGATVYYGDRTVSPIVNLGSLTTGQSVVVTAPQSWLICAPGQNAQVSLTGVSTATGSGGTSLVTVTGPQVAGLIPAHRQGLGISTGDFPWGLSTAQIAAEMALVASTGADSVRLDMKWDIVQGGGSGTFDWSKADVLFDAADAQGLRVMFCIINCPAWANASAGYIVPPTNPADFGTFAAACATRYKSRGSFGCHWWEIINEPNNPQYYGAITGYATFVAQIGAAYTAIKTADPTATVVCGGPTSGQSSSENQTSTTLLNLDTFWLTQCYAAGLAGKFDAMGYHPYSKGWDPLLTQPTGLGSGIELVTNQLAANATNWFGDNATIAWAATPVPAGATGVLSITPTTTSFPGAHFQKSQVPVIASQAYLGQALVLAATVAEALNLSIAWYDIGGSAISTSAGIAVVDTTTGWTTITVRATAPSNAATAQFQVKSAGAVGNTHYLALPSFQTSGDTGLGWNRVATIRSIMVANGDAAKPIWITEVGQASSSATFGVTEAVQANYLGRALQRLRQFPYVQRLWWYSDYDSGTDTTNLGQNYGLYHNDQITPKASLAAFRDGVDATGWVAAQPSTLDAAVSAGVPSTNIPSWTHNVGANPNRALIVAVVTPYLAAQASGVTCGATAMTQLGSIVQSGVTGSDRQVSLWYLLNPPVGANTITATVPGGANRPVCGSVSYYNVNQTTPFGTVGTFTSATSSSDSTTTSETTNDAVFAVVGGHVAQTPGGSQTALWTNNSGGTVYETASNQPGGSSVTSSFTVTDTGSSVLVAVPVLGASISSTLLTTAALAGYAPLASPAITGTPTAPTATPLTASTQLATTAYADSATAVEAARAATAEALKAPLASPTFTGSPAAPTPTAGDSSTRLSTTAYGTAAFAPQNPKLITPVVMPGLLPTSAQAATTNRLYFVRVIVPRAGTLAGLAFLVTTQSGNVIATIYDTGDASAGNRTQLYTSGSTAVAAAGWQTFAPSITVTPGQQLDFALIFDNATVNFGRVAQPVAGNAQFLPTSFFPAAGGASPKLTGTFDVGSFSAPTPVAEASVASTSSVAPVIIGRLT